MFGQDNNQDDNQWQPGNTDESKDTAANAPVMPTAADNTTSPGDAHPQAASTGTAAAASVPANVNTDELLRIKQEALKELSPLVGQLEQTPEEKFRTTMMMIQAADNHNLLQDAYDAAKQIPDEKIRAQALLDVINEVNFFTQQK